MFTVLDFCTDEQKSRIFESVSDVTGLWDPSLLPAEAGKPEEVMAESE